MEICLNESNLIDACHWLAQRDPQLAWILEHYGYPPLWAREPGFSTLIHILLEQQVSLASANAAFGRLCQHIDVVTPSKFMTINDEDLLMIGFSRQKRTYARGLAEAILDQSFDLSALHNLPDEQVRAQMTQLKGIGHWTADIYLSECLLRPDILPKGDIALYESYRRLHGLDIRPKFEVFEAKTQHWRPWRSVGIRMLWHFYLCERSKNNGPSV